jgi:protoporphyrinogen oxidase
MQKQYRHILHQDEEDVKTIILGCGLAGLGAASELQKHGLEFEILEKEPTPGGLVKTDIIDGFALDRIGHFFHFKTKYLQNQLAKQGISLKRYQRQAAVIINGSAIPYPIQYNLWSLPIYSRHRALGDLKSAQSSSRKPKTFYEAITSSWGATLTKLFFSPYNEKLWQRSLDALPADCAGRYMPQVDVAMAERGCHNRQNYLGYNATFFYPKSGRIGDTTYALAARFTPNIRYNTEVVQIDTDRYRCYSSEGEFFEYDRLISTLPLPALIAMTKIGLDISPMFDHTRVLSIRVGFQGEMNAPFHWIYTPKKKLPFYRIVFPNNLNLKTCPPGCASILIEHSIENDKQKPRSKEIASEALTYLSGNGFVDVEKMLVLNSLTISPAYLVYRASGRNFFTTLRKYLKTIGIFLAGRFGIWDYLSMEEAFLSGRQVILSHLSDFTNSQEFI